MHSRGKQVVLSSDRPPRAMVTLAERLRSRFEWGLMADIQLPDQETRIAILQSKAEEKGVKIPRGVTHFIAHHVRSNIRELEGALTKVIAHSTVRNVAVTMDLAQIALADFIRQPDKVTLDQVIEAVTDYYGVSVKQLKGRGRKRSVSYPRQVAMYLGRTETGSSFPKIGAKLGGRDHTTVMHGYEKIAAKADIDTSLRRDILEIKAVLYDSKIP